MRAAFTIPVLAIVLSSVSCVESADDTMTDHPVTEYRHTNRLIDENSPYLLSHAHNPVDWYPWGEAALSRAVADDKPIFLSIGYAACHWCHVMERESFENEAVADFLNEHFVAIKVDREQRPDLDHIYMAFTQALTGSGGWPMSVFLTPDLKPFFAGTYFPAVDSRGRPSFMKVITEIADTYRRDKQTILTSSARIYETMSRRLSAATPATDLSRKLVFRAATDLMRNFDEVHGGFGNRPKFPPSLALSLWFRHYRSTGDESYLAAAEKTLLAMSRGGIYDHLGGGFARYSTDRQWLVPHFEKMLYDNSLLIPTYVEAWQLTHRDTYLKTIGETLDWMLREMADPTGGFYSSLDADSEGEEGKFYVWSKAEIVSVLGPERAEPFLAYYNVSDRGNFEGHNILHLSAASERAGRGTAADEFERSLAESRSLLLDRRTGRIRPLTDDKILTSWNGLALTALCRGYQVTGEDAYLAAAIKNASFVTETLWRDGRLTHSYREGRYSTGQFLEDYAFYVRGLIDLYETDLSDRSERWLGLAQEMVDAAIDLFLDSRGTFYLRPDGRSDLIIRPKDEHDGAIPAPGSLMIGNLFKLYRLTDDARYAEAGEQALNALSGQIAANPSRYVSALLALDYHLSDKIELILVGRSPTRDGMLREVHDRFIPNRTIAATDNSHSTLSLFEGKVVRPNEVTAYLCENSACLSPVTTVPDLAAQLRELGF